eukprot:gene28370-31499_t
MLVLKSDDTTWNGTIVEGKADDTIFQAYRIMRCGRSMLLEHEGMVPVIQPTVLQYDLDGAKANSTVFFLSKVLYGRLDVREVLKVASSTTAESLSGAIQREVKKNGACVLESFGKMAAVTSLKAVLQARRDLTALGVDIAMVLDPVVVEVDAEYEATTLMNRTESATPPSSPTSPSGRPRPRVELCRLLRQTNGRLGGPKLADRSAPVVTKDLSAFEISGVGRSLKSASTSTGAWFPSGLNPGPNRSSNESEVYVLGRPFNDWGGGLFKKLPPPVKEAVLNLGLCHYLVAIKQPCGTVVQYDFGPIGGDIGVSTSQAGTGLPAEVRETCLEGGIPEGVPALFIGKTTVELDSVREFNAHQPNVYALYASDCRHYANGLVKHLTGTERSTAHYLRHRYLAKMTNSAQGGFTWHMGLYEMAQAVADIENWRNEQDRQRLLLQGLLHTGMGALTTSTTVLLATKPGLATGLASGLVNAVPKVAGGSLRAATVGLSRYATGFPALVHLSRAATARSLVLLPSLSQLAPCLANPSDTIGQLQLLDECVSLTNEEFTSAAAFGLEGSSTDAYLPLTFGPLSPMPAGIWHQGFGPDSNSLAQRSLTSRTHTTSFTSGPLSSSQPPGIWMHCFRSAINSLAPRRSTSRDGAALAVSMVDPSPAHASLSSSADLVSASMAIVYRPLSFSPFPRAWVSPWDKCTYEPSNRQHVMAGAMVLPGQELEGTGAGTTPERSQTEAALIAKPTRPRAPDSFDYKIPELFSTAASLMMPSLAELPATPPLPLLSSPSRLCATLKTSLQASTFFLYLLLVTPCLSSAWTHNTPSEFSPRSRVGPAASFDLGAEASFDFAVNASPLVLPARSRPKITRREVLTWERESSRSTDATTRYSVAPEVASALSGGEQKTKRRLTQENELGDNFGYRGEGTKDAGSVLTGDVDVYNIWYGDWKPEDPIVRTLNRLVDDLGNSTWYNIIRKYYFHDSDEEADKKFIEGKLQLKGYLFVPLSEGPLIDALPDFIRVLGSKFQTGELPLQTVYRPTSSSPATLYMFISHHDAFASRSVPGGRMCTDACGRMTNLMFGLTVLGFLEAPGNAILWVEEIADGPEENADICQWTYDRMLTLSNGKFYNTVIGGKTFVIQQNFDIMTYGRLLTLPNGKFHNTIIGGKPFLIQQNFDIVSNKCAMEACTKPKRNSKKNNKKLTKKKNKKQQRNFDIVSSECAREAGTKPKRNSKKNTVQYFGS